MRTRKFKDFTEEIEEVKKLLEERKALSQKIRKLRVKIEMQNVYKRKIGRTDIISIN